MNDTPLNKISREDLLRNAYLTYRVARRNKGRPLWAFVADMTCHGSTYSARVCRELGWEPDMKVGTGYCSDLPPRTSQITSIAGTEGGEKPIGGCQPRNPADLSDSLGSDRPGECHDGGSPLLGKPTAFEDFVDSLPSTSTVKHET